MSHYYSVKDFNTLIDEELKQSQNAHRTALADSMRLAKETEILHWINQALGELLEYNKGFYFRVVGYTPLADSTSIELPFFVRRLDQVYVDSTWYNISFYGDSASKVWYDGGRKISGNNISFSANSEILLKGVHSPDRVVDEDSIIDFPPTYIRLLLLQVLLYFTGRDDRKKTIWYSQYINLLRTYKSSVPNVSAYGKTEAPFSFGEY